MEDLKEDKGGTDEIVGEAGDGGMDCSTLGSLEVWGGGCDAGATLGGRIGGIEVDGGSCFVEEDDGEGNKSLRLRMVANLVKLLFIGWITCF